MTADLLMACPSAKYRVVSSRFPEVRRSRKSLGQCKWVEILFTSVFCSNLFNRLKPKRKKSQEVAISDCKLVFSAFGSVVGAAAVYVTIAVYSTQKCRGDRGHW